MRCPECGGFQIKCTESRAAGSTRVVANKERRLTPVCVEKRWGKNYVFRKRKCLSCDHRFSTVEVVVTKKGYQMRRVSW